MAASSDRLGNLHALFTQYWEVRMQEAVHEDPEQRVPLSSSELAVLRAFLKDNGVQADPTGDKELQQLAGELKQATQGVVTGNELDDIMRDFEKHLGGGSLQ